MLGNFACLGIQKPFFFKFICKTSYNDWWSEIRQIFSVSANARESQFAPSTLDKIATLYRWFLPNSEFENHVKMRQKNQKKFCRIPDQNSSLENRSFLDTENEKRIIGNGDSKAQCDPIQIEKKWFVCALPRQKHPDWSDWFFLI